MNKIVKVLFSKKNLVSNIFELDNDSKKHQSRFEYLDGYRGSLAIVVAISHTIPDISRTSDIWKLTIGYSLTYGVAGFFMLSAFLLTFRLLEELNNAQNQQKSQQLILIIIKYFIRRFFRIYLVYLLFFLVFKYGPKRLSEHEFINYNVSFDQIIRLGNSGRNHLWTIPPEIRYYFFIPLFCLIVYNLGRLYQWIFLILCVIWTIYDQMFNFFGLNVNQLMFGYEGIHYLYVHFAVFFMGSQVALAYYLISKSEWTKRYFNNYYIHLSLDWISLSIAFIGLHQTCMKYYDTSDYTYRSRPTIYWSFVLLLTLLSGPNTISEFFGSSRILKSVGKYSFSFYLVHISVGYWLRQINFFNPLGLVITCFGITYVISFFTFYLIENQLIRLANHLCSKLDNYFVYKH